ncbi:hypothetical protein ACIRP2_38650 [Streptomyces sp. NPDC101194]|uniref:hypothetical protein n=1 Tax=Streptomyces sp. NPDC101194 TaxID=3366127 RepID=UPI0038103567
MKRFRRGGGVASAALLTLALLAGCGKQDDWTEKDTNGGTGARKSGVPVSVDGLTKAADRVGPDGADRCPLPYDMKKAADAVGLSGRVGTRAASEGDTDAPVATAENERMARPGEGLADNPGALVSCAFHIGDEAVEVHTIATRKPRAESPLAPVIMSAGRLSLDGLTAYLKRTAASAPGEPVVTDSGACAVVRVKPVGAGDAALLVTAGDGGRTGLTAQQMTALTRALYAQTG